MKATKEIMESMGFISGEGFWQHGRYREIIFTDLPEVSEIVKNSFLNGHKHGREDAQYNIREAIGIN